ncbi:MAG: hypothetical protein FWG84_03170 [Bacteroidales bacterium]|nr:hypothetical protein [Bacteroidales bacterium]
MSGRIYQNSDGTYLGANATSYDTESAAEASLRHAAAGAAGAAERDKILGNFLDFAGKALIIIPVLGALACLFMTIFAGLRGFIILAKTFWLFDVCALIIAFVVYLGAIHGFWKSVGGFKGILRKGVIGPVFSFLSRVAVSFLIGVVVSIPFFWLSYKYYCRSDMHFASLYSVDYIQALPDGKAPVVYEKRFQKGKILAEPSIGEKVTVNGITVGLAQFNITTADSVTGWVDRAAFPEEAAEMLSININVDGFDSEDIAIDREAERLIERYMDVKKTGGGAYVVNKQYTISQNTLNRSIRVNAQTPLMAVGHEAYRDGAKPTESGAILTLENILYADDCTLVYLTVTDTKVRDLYGTFNTTAWKKSLTVTDLETGEKYPLLQADYKPTWKWEQTGNNFKSSIVFFFPPFKSRHFSLTREASPLPSDSKAGYGGILGWIAKITSGGSTAEYLDYNFMDIKVK